MKAIALFKREIMDLHISAYVLWIVCMASGCFAYMNAPAWIVNIGDIVSAFHEAIQFIWGLGVAFAMGFIAVISTKVANKWWEERGKLAYERWFPKRKKRKESKSNNEE